MKAPTSSPKLQLLLPHPVQARRLRWLLYGTLLAAAALLLLFLTAYLSAPTARLHALALLAGSLLLGWWGYTLTRRKLPEVTTILRNGMQRFFRTPLWLGLLSALPAVRLILLLALETDRSLPELLLAYRWLLGMLLALSLLLLLRRAIGNALDRVLFRRLQQQEQMFSLLLEEVKAAADLRSAAQNTMRLLNQLWQPQHIRLLFQEATLTDFHFSADALSPPTHLPIDFPLARLFTLANPNLTAAETAWVASLQADLLVPMRGMDDSIVGLMTLGRKQSAQPYTPEEKRYLLAITCQLTWLSERTQGKVTADKNAQSRLAKLARLEAEQRRASEEETREEDDHNLLLVQEHLNDLPQRQELPARAG